MAGNKFALTDEFILLRNMLIFDRQNHRHALLLHNTQYFFRFLSLVLQHVPLSLLDWLHSLVQNCSSCHLVYHIFPALITKCNFHYHRPISRKSSQSFRFFFPLRKLRVFLRCDFDILRPRFIRFILSSFPQLGSFVYQLLTSVVGLHAVSGL